MATFTISRRTFLTGAAAITAAMTTPAWAREKHADGQHLHFYVGAYTTKTSKGVYPLSYDVAADRWALGQPDTAIENASFGAPVYGQAKGRPLGHYLLDEQDTGKVGFYHHGPNGWALQHISPTDGAAPCFVSVSQTHHLIGIANYTSGNVIFYPYDSETGALKDAQAIVYQNKGSGPNTARQEGPHAHCVQFAPDDRYAYSVDLGTDQLLGYPLGDKDALVGQPFEAFKFPGGTGPRHLRFHPNGRTAFVVSELSNEVFSLHQGDDGKFSLINKASTLPEDFTAHSQAAHLILSEDGTRLYASNRGHNSIAVFAIDGEGALKRMQIAPTLGDWPRFFKLVESHKRLIVAHQNGGTLVVFKLQNDGTLTPANVSLDVPAAVFIGDLI